jgi:hypothetical protein
VAAIVEGQVARTWNEFDSRLGPRMFVEFSDVITHAGQPPSSNTFSQLGGPVPDGRYVVVSELPTLSAGARYVFFFGRQATAYTAIWAGLAFRLEAVAGRTVVLEPEGKPVLSFGLNRVEFGPSPVIAPSADGSPYPPTGIHPVPQVAADVIQAVERAMSPSEFLLAAVEATVQAGGPLNETYDMDPEPTERWDVRPNTPASETARTDE